MTKRVCQRATSASLPSTVLHDILAVVNDGRDVAAYLAALPVATLPPELTALRDLGAAVDLADHWPVVHITKIPIEHVRLGIAALPAFSGIYVDAGYTALAWLDATLPPTMPLTLVVDPSVLGTLSAFAYNWGHCVTDVLVNAGAVQPDPIPDLLGRCVNVRSVTIKIATMRNAPTYMAALPMQHVHTLSVSAFTDGPMDASAIVSWLQGPHATSLTLKCSEVQDPTALANAIQACTTLRSLSLAGALDVQEALMALPEILPHIASLSLFEASVDDGVALGLIRKLDRTKVVSFAFKHNKGNCEDDGDEAYDVNQPATDVFNALVVCPMLQTLRLVNVYASSVMTTRGVWTQLSTVAVRHTTFDTTDDVVQFIQWLSTSRCLTSVDLSFTPLGTEGFVELARALPAWMARGLQTLVLRATEICDDDVVLLVVALATRCNRRHLTVNLRTNRLTLTSVTLLLGMLGPSHRITLQFDSNFNNDTVERLVQLHKLQQIMTGVVTSPQTSPWHTL